MKKLFNLNISLLLTNLVLYFTIYLGMLFSMILGATQILMSIIILIKFKTLSTLVKKLFITYLILTLLLLVVLTKTMYSDFTGNYGLLFWFVIPMILACYHVFITYKIKTS
ncbi:MAG: hypothetical protein AAF901_00840 [Bacteroidota bacterium]